MARLHEPVEPVRREDGWEEHPAFGAISVHRINSHPGAVLFDSEIAHTRFIRVRVEGMERKRHLNSDRLHAVGPTVVEVDMSESQWAAFVSSVGTQGVPCTIRGTVVDRDLPGLPFDPRLAISAKEAREAAERAFAKIKAAADRLAEIGPTGPVKERRAAMRDLEIAIANAPANVEFATKSLTEHTENVVTKARADIEAMVANHAEARGIEPADVGFRPALTEGTDMEGYA